MQKLPITNTNIQNLEKKRQILLDLLLQVHTFFYKDYSIYFKLCYYLFDLLMYFLLLSFHISHAKYFTDAGSFSKEKMELEKNFVGILLSACNGVQGIQICILIYLKLFIQIKY